MGSYNGTCMLSHLPIMSGDKIKLVILHYGYSKITPSGGYCYSNGIFTPAYLPISGEYNDYGMIENIVDDFSSRLILLHLKQRYKKIKTDKQHNDFTLIEFLEGITSNDLMVLCEGDKERKKLAENAIKIYSKQGFSSEKIEREWREFASEDVTEQWRVCNMSFVMIRQDVWDSILNKYSPDTYKNIKYKEHLMRELTDAKNERAATRIFIDAYAGGGNLLIPSYYALALLKKEIQDDVKKTWVEFQLITSFMNTTRIGWMVQSGAGSQADDWDSHLILSEIVSEICKSNIDESNTE